MTDETMSIREMCDAFDVTPRTLRFYESKELLFPRRVGQKRLFTKRDRARLKLILRGKRFGFSLEDIRQFLIIYEAEGTRAQMETWVGMADKQLETLEAQRRELDETISELRKLRDESYSSLK